MLEACLKLTARSKGLEREIGCGYENFIINHKGEYYVGEEDEKKVCEAVSELPADLSYLEKTLELRESALTILGSAPIELSQIPAMLVEQLTAFYIARIKADILFDGNDLTKDQRDFVMQWRNDISLFDSHDRFLEVASGRFNIAEEILDMFTLKEIQTLMKGNPVDQRAVKERLRSAWSVSLKERGEEVLMLDEYLSPKISSEENVQAKELRGSSVVGGFGKIRGIVGKDILVAEMTRPEMIGVIRKSKAVITNQGGILSHAAVTCRELNIPCVIATKIATQVLKDGDEVEVDADSGVIRKLG